MASPDQNRDALFYARRLFTPCFLLTVCLFLLRVWLDASWVEHRVRHDIGRAAQYTSVEKQHDILIEVILRLDRYKQHVAGASVLIPGLDATRIDTVREHMDWYRLQTTNVYAESQYHDDWLNVLDDFLANYELGDLGVMRPDQRRKFNRMLQVLAVITGVALLFKLSWHEWGET